MSYTSSLSLSPVEVHIKLAHLLVTVRLCPAHVADAGQGAGWVALSTNLPAASGADTAGSSEVYD